MKKGFNNSGFSLTEVLLAVGTLSIGMMFIGGTFMAGIYFSTIATERTIASVASDEAFAKVKLYGGAKLDWLSDLSSDSCVDFNEVSSITVDPNEFAYPSVRTGLAETQYFWSALCRLTEPDTPANPNPSVQVTVFVSRRAGSGMKYRSPVDPLNLTVDYPVPVKVDVSGTVGSNVLTIQEPDKITWINDGCTIVENATGRIYRVIERGADPDYPARIILDTFWQGGGSVWVVPPAFGSGKYPCIAVYQRVIGF